MKPSTQDHNKAVRINQEISHPYTGVRKLLPLLATIAVIPIMVGLSSCAGYTSAAKVGGGGTPGNPGAGVLSPNSTSLAFGKVTMGSTGTQSVTVTNTGTSAVSISSSMIAGAAFTVTGGNPASSLAVGQSETVQIQFAPTATGAATGTFTITSDASDSPLAISLSGTGTSTQAQISASPASVAFSNVVVGNSNSQPIKLQNNGNATLTFSQIAVAGTGMTVTGLTTTTTIAAGGNASFNAVFTPTAATTVNGSITLTTNGTPSPLTINLSGTGVAATQVLTANPASLSFGTVNVNSSSQMTSTLTNNGNSSVTISTVTATGAGFSASGVPNGTILTPGQSAPLTVTFAPTTAGAVNGASVSIASNATGSPTVIALSGTGQTVSSRSVALSWTASVTAGVNGYNVFRATTSGGYGPTPLNPSPVSTTSYTDSSVVSGQQYFYVVTALDAGVSSADSTEVSVTIP